MMTTVITNFQRPKFLRRALQSLAAAHVSNVVISSCGTTSEIEGIHQWAKTLIKNLDIVSRREVIDCNESWLAGLRACKTEYVHILHDDDVVDKEFATVAANLGSDVDMILTDAFFQTGAPEIPSQPFMHAPILGAHRGRNSPELLIQRLMGKGGFGLSPINGIIRKEFAIDALEESAGAFAGPEWHVRPTMMVGNDLLLWIRSCQRARTLYYDNRPLVGYGLHGTSTTVDHMARGQSGVLTGIYDRVRDYVTRNPKYGKL